MLGTQAARKPVPVVLCVVLSLLIWASAVAHCNEVVRPDYQQIRLWRMDLARARNPMEWFDAYTDVMLSIGDSEFTFGDTIINKRSLRVLRMSVAPHAYIQQYSTANPSWAADFFKGTYSVYGDIVSLNTERLVWLTGLLGFVADWSADSEFYQGFFDLAGDQFEALIDEYLSLLETLGSREVPSARCYYSFTDHDQPMSEYVEVTRSLAALVVAVGRDLPYDVQEKILEFVIDHYPYDQHTVVIYDTLVETQKTQHSLDKPIY